MRTSHRRNNEVKIPTNPMYDIDENSVVRLISTNEVIREYLNHYGKRSVKIRGKSHKPSSHPLDRLMLNTYKPLPPDKDPEWMSVKFLDGNKDNLSISNLEWDDTWWYPHPLLGIEFGTTSWVDAYELPSIEIRLNNHEFLIRCKKTWREIGFHEQGGYYTLTIPGTSDSIKLHRLLALTFLPHPIDTRHLTVNHKDSNKKNNDLRNLEWATYSENNFHSYNEGPRSETVRKIRLRNLMTDEETVVSGYNEMGRVLGVLPQAAHQAIERRTFEGREYKGYVFKYEDDRRTWEELAVSGPREFRRRPEKIAVRNMDTGEVKIYNKFMDMLNSENMRDFMAYRLLNSKAMIPWRRRCIQEIVDGRPLKWPDYPEYILSLYATIHSSDRPIMVTHEDGSVEYHTSVTNWCAEDRVNRCDPAVLSRYMKKSKGKECRWRDWVFSHIDLSRYPLI